MDLIDRQQAINALKAIKYGLWEIDIPSPTVPEYVEHHKQIKDMMEITERWIQQISELPSAQPKMIPCSKRMPEKNGEYLIQCKDAKHLTVVTYWNGYWNAHNNCTDYAFRNVCAWAPLPELYEEEPEEEPDEGKDLS